MGQIKSTTQIPQGTPVFVDANIFIYHFVYEAAESQLCTSLLKRIEIGDIKGFTSTIVLAEIAHRLMVFEAIEKHELNPRNAVRFLKEHPEKVMLLKKHLDAVNEMREMNIHIMTVASRDIFQA